MKLVEQGVIREEALLAYANNELGAEEKQELEKLLKDDPFAQDALEGLHETNKATVTTSVLNINKKIRERTGVKEKKMLALHWTNYAWAAVVFGLLIGVGFLMVTYLGKPDSSIAMNKKEEVNLLEKKIDEPNLVPVATSIVTDTIAVSEQQKIVADESAAKQTPAQEIKQPDDKKTAEGEIKNIKAVTGATNVQTVTATGGAAAPTPPVVNSTGLAGNNVMVTSKTSINTNATPKGKNKEEVAVNANQIANSDAVKSETKSVAKEERVKQSAPSKKEDNAPAMQTELRGSIVEKVPAEKITVITMDDAMKSFNGGDYKKSSDEFSEILKQQPNNADALYFGGISDYINGNTKKSEKNFDKLLKDGTKFSEGSKWYKANILLKKGKKDEAKKLLDELANTGGSYKERAVKKKAEVEF